MPHYLSLLPAHCPGQLPSQLDEGLQALLVVAAKSVDSQREEEDPFHLHLSQYFLTLSWWALPTTVLPSWATLATSAACEVYCRILSPLLEGDPEVCQPQSWLEPGRKQSDSLEARWLAWNAVW